MALTPGWKAKKWDEACDGDIVSFHITQTPDFYFLDNGTEYKSYFNNKHGWAELCDDLKGMIP